MKYSEKCSSEAIIKLKRINIPLDMVSLRTLLARREVLCYILDFDKGKLGSVMLHFMSWYEGFNTNQMNIRPT